MKITMQMAKDGLVQALRWKVHALAEDLEGGYRPGDPGGSNAAGQRMRPGMTERSGGQDDGRAGD